ncbi:MULTISPECIES: hypothetical protein [Burkholderia]|nr:MULTISPECIES: hypothetical protein [Burkholderia]
MIQITTKPRARQLSTHNWMVYDKHGNSVFETTLDAALKLYFRCVLFFATERRL